MLMARGLVRTLIAVIALGGIVRTAQGFPAQSVEPQASKSQDPRASRGVVLQSKPMPELDEPDERLLRSGVVHRVIDGDSVELFVDGQIVAYELAGADAREILDGQETQLRGSVEAKVYLEGLIVGEQIAVLPDRKRATDARGRLRGYLYRMPDMMLVNLEMVRVGHAKHARDPLGFNDTVMLWAQERAKSARKGVWSPTPIQPAPNQLTAEVPAASGGQLAAQNELNRAEGSAEIDDADRQVDRAASSTDGGTGRVVYVTRSGSKYHRKDCQHARASGIAKDRDSLDAEYKPCKVCEPDAPRDGD